MQRVRRFGVAVCLVVLVAANASAQGATGGGQAAMSPKSLYERLGGLDAITAVTDEFIKILAADERINKKLAKSDGPRVRLHFIEFVCVQTGGPCKYTGNSMKKTHKNMGVTDAEFTAGVEDLVKALDKFNVPTQERNELLNLLAPLKKEIVEVHSNATGTPLPDKFKPAPALPKSQIDAGPAMKNKKP